MGTYYKHVHVKIVRFYVQEKLFLMQLVLCIRYMYCVLYCKAYFSPCWNTVASLLVFNVIWAVLSLVLSVHVSSVFTKYFLLSGNSTCSL